jgi:hypothetical protein
LLDDVLNCEVRRYSLEDNGMPCVYGKLCDHGHTRIDIWADTGIIRGCMFDDQPIGNIYMGELNLSDGPRYCQYTYCFCASIPYDKNTVNFVELSKPAPHVIRKHYDMELYKELKEILVNPYFDGINLNPITQEEKESTLVILEKADKADSMFYESYMLQGSLYETLGKPKAAARAYKKAIKSAPRRNGN